MKVKKTKIDGKSVIINELSVRDVLYVIDQIKDISSEGITVADLNGEKFDNVIEVISRVVEFDDKDFDIRDLAFSDIDILYDAFSEVNASFLARAKQMSGLILGTPPPKLMGESS